MEDSMNSYMQNPVVSKATIDQSPDEESGWTAYFEDFSNNNKEEEHIYCSSFGSPSVVSDAASYAAWNLSHNHNPPCCSIGGSPKVPKKLKFKKSRTVQIYHDDSLEDTASSPVNSPKVSDLEKMGMNPKKTEDHMYSSLGKEAASEHYPELEPEERNGNFKIGKNNDCTDLKRRGLCLVPFSMLVNYLG